MKETWDIRLLRFLLGLTVMALVGTIAYIVLYLGVLMTLKLLCLSGFVLIGLLLGVNIAFGRWEDILKLIGHR